MDGNNEIKESPAGESAPAATTAEAAKDNTPSEAHRTYSEAELQAAVQEALKKAGLDAQSITAKQAELEGKLKEANTAIFNAGVANIAQKHKVDTKALLEKANKYGMADLSNIEDLATIMKSNDADPLDINGAGGGGKDLSVLTPEEKYLRGWEKAQKKRES